MKKTFNYLVQMSSAFFDATKISFENYCFKFSKTGRSHNVLLTNSLIIGCVN